MSAPIVATPQLHTARDLKVAIDADLQARGVHAVVEVGAWGPELLRGEPRVTIELGDATIGEPRGRYVPGAWWPVNGGADVARPMLDDEQTYTLSIHAPAAVGVADVSAEAAQDATDQLLRAAMAGLRRQIAGPFRSAARVTWPKRLPGYPAFVHGSLAVVSLVIASPILDDAATLGRADDFDIEGTVSFGDAPPVTALET